MERLADFPINDRSPVEHSGYVPQQADLVIVGGGVVGVCTALFAARKGVQVVLVEKGRIAGEQSSRNWGWIRQQGRDPDELPIMLEAVQLWRDFAKLTNEDIGLVQGGITYMAKDDAELAKFEAWLPHAQQCGVDTKLLSRAELRALIPGATRDWPGGLFTASDMRAEPWVAVPALARLAVREGAILLEGCAARGLDIVAGRVAGVVTECGRIAAPEVVVAGGAWSSLFLRNAGVSIPQLSVRATVAAAEAGVMPYQGGGADNEIAFRARRDGGYSLAAGEFHEFFIGRDAVRHAAKYATQLKSDPFGTRFLPAAPKGYPDAWGTARKWDLDARSPFEDIRILNPKPNAKKVRDLVSDFAKLFPSVGAVRAKSAWAGMIDTLPDRVPVLDRGGALEGLTIATGLSGHGFGIGPAVGRILADLVMGHDVNYDLSRFRFSRFSDGSRINLGPAL